MPWIWKNFAKLLKQKTASHGIFKSTNPHDFLKANLCVCLCERVALPRGFAPPAVTSSSRLGRTQPSGHRSVPAALIFLVFAHPVSTSTICLRRRGKVPAKTHIYYTTTATRGVCVCVCVRKKIKGDRDGRLWEMRFPAFSK